MQKECLNAGVRHSCSEFGERLDDSASYHWLARFMARHGLKPSSLQSEDLSKSEIRHRVVKSWRKFDEALKKAVKYQQQLDAPSEIVVCNLDETGLRRCHRSNKIVIPADHKRPTLPTISQSGDNLLAILTSNPALRFTPHLIVRPPMDPRLAESCRGKVIVRTDNENGANRLTKAMFARVLQTILEEKRARERAVGRRFVLILTCDPLGAHDNLSEETTALCESSGLFQVITEAGVGKYVQPADVGGLFRSVKAHCRRNPHADYVMTDEQFVSEVLGYVSQYSVASEFTQCGMCCNRQYTQLHSRLKEVLGDIEIPCPTLFSIRNARRE